MNQSSKKSIGKLYNVYKKTTTKALACIHMLPVLDYELCSQEQPTWRSKLMKGISNLWGA